MPAKLILSMDGVVLQEYPLNKERMTIGRKSHNDIVIDNLAVSGEHAAIVTIQNDSFLEDLDSTNGVTVNGMSTKKHFLQNNDVVEIGKYKLKYLNDQPSQTTAADFERTMVLRAPAKQAAPRADMGGITNTQVGAQTAARATQAEATGKFDTTGAPGAAAGGQAGSQAAVVQILNGPNSGKELELVKNLTTLGKPGVQVAVLARRPHGYFITHVEGANYPVVNGESLGEHPRQLNDHDIIELAGVKMEFYFKS
ncbi:MAG TPA: FHA domain-containing protein [Gallionellaceae bacterium]|nr:FHA domain-containing protein [Gallionellaceae bacterium]